MSEPFNATAGLILVGAELEGPTGTAVLQLALDTGATSTVINIAVLVAVGYDPALAPNRVQMTTGSGVQYAPLVAVSRLRTLGQERLGLDVLGHTLPPGTGVDGLLGLDFLRGLELRVDFRSGQITLA